MSERAVLMSKDPTKGPAPDSRRPKFAAQLHPGQQCDPCVPGALKALVLSGVKEVNHYAYLRRHDFVRVGSNALAQCKGRNTCELRIRSKRFNNAVMVIHGFSSN